MVYMKLLIRCRRGLGYFIGAFYGLTLNQVKEIWRVYFIHKAKASKIPTFLIFNFRKVMKSTLTMDYCNRVIKVAHTRTDTYTHTHTQSHTHIHT